jgi:arylsulfatase A-like enzyme
VSPGSLRRLAAGAARSLGAFGLGAALLAGCRPAPVTTTTELHLMDRLDRAEVSTSFGPLAGLERELAFDRRHAVRLHPPGHARFDAVPNPEGAVLRLGVGIDPRVPEGGNGARVEIGCAGAAGGRHRLATLDLPPRTKRWADLELPLDRCARPTTDLAFWTGCGALDECGFDHVLLADPRVELPATFERVPSRLVLLISIDTLRPDRLALFGHSRPTSPGLDRLAADGVAFETAVAPSPWTVPSHASLFTSTDPLVHGAEGQETAISPGLAMLAESFRSAGWRTAAFVDSDNVGRRYGFARGFDVYDQDEGRVEGEFRRGGERTLAHLVDWLSTRSGGRAFVFWHLMEPHAPYGAPAPFGGRFRAAVRGDGSVEARLARLAALELEDHRDLGRFHSVEELLAAYDESVLHADALVGRLLEHLRRIDRYEDATVVVTSDHGETLLDHGDWLGHSLLLTESEVRIPLVVKLPAGRHAGRRVRELVRLLDVAPTLLEVAGLPIPASFAGRSLLGPLAARDGEGFPRLAFGHSSATGAVYVRTGERKLIARSDRAADLVAARLGTSGGTPAWLPPLLAEQLYDLAVDPGERTNLAASDPGAAELRQTVAAWAASSRREAARFGHGVSEAPTEEELRRLRALGYLD